MGRAVQVGAERTNEAPRLRASMPIAPVPANRSHQTDIQHIPGQDVKQSFLNPCRLPGGNVAGDIPQFTAFGRAEMTRRLIVTLHTLPGCQDVSMRGDDRDHAAVPSSNRRPRFAGWHPPLLPGLWKHLNRRWYAGFTPPQTTPVKVFLRFIQRRRGFTVMPI